MPKKLLISLPCNIRELKAKIDNFDSCDVVVCQYDGDGDSLYVYVNQVMEECDKHNAKPKDISKCKHLLGCHCGSETVKDFGSRQILAGMSPFVCPFNDGNECKDYEPKEQE